MIDAHTMEQLDALAPINRPLLVCDVDEVILHLVAPFESLLKECGMTLRKKKVKLTGNVFHLADNRKASQDDIWKTLNQLFEEQAERQQVVTDAAETMVKLFSDIDIVLLTNLPHEYGDIRREHLRNLGIPYPMITNSGAKGPPLQWLNGKTSHRLAFMDDTNHHLESVSEYTPETFLVHFMADEEFRNMTKARNPPILSTGNWREAGDAVHLALC